MPARLGNADRRSDDSWSAQRSFHASCRKLVSKYNAEMATPESSRFAIANSLRDNRAPFTQTVANEAGAVARPVREGLSALRALCGQGCLCSSRRSKHDRLSFRHFAFETS